jgi:hypothetical protein
MRGVAGTLTEAMPRGKDEEVGEDGGAEAGGVLPSV